MECYNCGAQLGRENYCSKCGADVKIYKKILMASNSFYNEGLERANVRNLSGAIESLKKSLELNKMNMDARNLLGLVYFEMGETVAALSEWVISKNYHSHNNIAGQYLGEIQNNPSRLDTINQTIKKYNQALLYCRQGSRDLAVIQLKKVLSLNPKLVKGHQLLALLYMQDGKYEQAKKSLRNAAKIDENNTMTQRYLKEANRELRESNPKKQKKDDLISYQSGNETIIMPAHFKDNSAVQTIINIVIGIVLGGAISMFLLLPNIKQQAKSDANTALKAANDTIATKEQTISSLQNKVDDLTKEMEDTKEASDTVETKLSSYEQLLTAYAAFVADDIDAAGTALEKVSADDLSEKAKTIYDDVNAKVNEKYLASMYQEGYSAYNKGNQTTAIEKLKKVVEMDESYQNGNAIYYLAQAYRRADDMEQAVIYYQKVLEQYPGTERARVAQSYVNAQQKNTSATQTTGQTTQDQQENTNTQDAAAQPDGADQQPADQPADQQPEAQGQ